MDELEATLAQAEGKHDSYVEKNKKLKAENDKLLDEVERKTKEHQQKIIDTRKGTRVFCTLRVLNFARILNFAIISRHHFSDSVEIYYSVRHRSVLPVYLYR